MLFSAIAPKGHRVASKPHSTPLTLKWWVPRLECCRYYNIMQDREYSPFCQLSSFVAWGDRSHDQSWYPATDHTITSGILRKNARSILASATNRTINRGNSRPIVDQSWHLRSIVQLVVPPGAESCDKPWQFASSRTTERDVVRRVAPPFARWHDQLHDQSWHCVIRDHPQLVVRQRTIDDMIT